MRMPLNIGRFELGFARVCGEVVDSCAPLAPKSRAVWGWHIWR